MSLRSVFLLAANDQGKDDVNSAAQNAPQKAMLTTLRQRREFLRLASQGRKVAMPGLVLQAAPTLAQKNAGPQPSGEHNAPQFNAPHIRVGFTASKKVGNAVARNRAKRRLRALAADIIGRHGQKGMDFVLIARAQTNERKPEDLQKDLCRALSKLSLWRDE
ncbi:MULTISPECIES: ribonuclease P protein component [unclassified Iodidimonas]|uniref:ribonuclease P protein component n=1 Tax=unclassified Iodidimonas TaxID=2626145 RepID=UPI002482A6E0|nr:MULTISPECIES: ribonuclease P protein component [unclassified Iodidimonas]